MAIAIDALTGQNLEHVTTLTPNLYAIGDTEEVEAVYASDEQVGWSTYVNIETCTSYNDSADLSACKAQGDQSICGVGSEMNMKTPTLSISIVYVSKDYGPVRALQGVDFSVGRGDVHALLGANGTGKVT